MIVNNTGASVQKMFDLDRDLSFCCQLFLSSEYWLCISTINFIDAKDLLSFLLICLQRVLVNSR